MSEEPRVRRPARERERRSQAERTAETRARIVAAVVESIGEVGYQRTTASEISRRSGVTWGAAQHHFGGKEGILAAVLEDSFNLFAERLADIPDEEAPLEKRVDAFIEGAWEHFGSPHFRSTFEILLNYAGEGADGEPFWQTEMFGAWNRIWDEIFADARKSRRDTVILQQYTISTLMGLASLRMLAGPTASLRSDELEILKRALVRELGG
jgi:AcrR family transcriptional regulator